MNIFLKNLTLIASTLNIVLICMEHPSSQPVTKIEKKIHILKHTQPIAHYISGHPDRPHIAAAWNPDGSVLISSAHNLILRDGKTGQPIKIIAEKHLIGTILFSPNGNRMVHRPCTSLCKDDAFLCDGRTGSHISNLISIPSQMHNIIKFSPDSARIIQSLSSHYAPYKSTVFTYNSSTGETLHKIEIPCFIYTLAYKPDYSFVAGGRAKEKEHELSLYQKSGLIKRLINNSNEIKLTVFNQDFSRLATASEIPYHAQDNGTSTLVLRDEKGDTIKQLNDHKNPISALAFSPNGKHLISGASHYNWQQNTEKNLIVWDADTGQKLHTIGNEKQIKQLIFSHDQAFLIVACFGKIYLYESATYKLIKTFHNSTFLALRPDDKYIAAECNQKLILWDLYNLNNNTITAKK